MWLRGLWWQIHVFACAEGDAIEERGGFEDAAIYVPERTRGVAGHMECCSGVRVEAGVHNHDAGDDIDVDAGQQPDISGFSGAFVDGADREADGTSVCEQCAAAKRRDRGVLWGFVRGISRRVEAVSTAGVQFDEAGGDQLLQHDANSNGKVT